MGVTLREAAERWGVSINSVRRWVKSGKLIAKIREGNYGQEYVIEEAEIERYEQKNAHRITSVPPVEYRPIPRPHLKVVAENLQYLMKYSPKGFVLTDENHEIVDVNQVFVKMCGYTRGQLIGHKPKMLASLDHLNEMQYPLMHQMLDQQGFWEGRFINRRPNGKIWYAHSIITMIRIGKQTVGYWAIVSAEDPVHTGL
ncbi:hypothetical protein BM613_08360 [Sulfoacidibacillus thermotolerans]|uniref:PAS domain-containing protein n=2 Tax=Sulfoacidibacillus thermotolerans TaxID=1765684 RepID=A0A2U3D864_SULT2|nr:hypothetical protein BM613_08360 [Sulfoacidibacillus thermotolerans]